jgi:malate dehydrogenase (quinone)
MNQWETKIKEMIPSYGMSLMENSDLLEEVHALTAKTLDLNEKERVYSGS